MPVDCARYTSICDDVAQSGYRGFRAELTAHAAADQSESRGQEESAPQHWSPTSLRRIYARHSESPLDSAPFLRHDLRSALIDQRTE